MRRSRRPRPDPGTGSRELTPDQRQRAARFLLGIARLALDEADTVYNITAGPYRAAWGISIVRSVRGLVDRIEFEINLREKK